MTELLTFLTGAAAGFFVTAGTFAAATLRRLERRQEADR